MIKNEVLMVLENKLGITNSADLAKEEEKLSKNEQLNCLKRNFVFS